MAYSIIGTSIETFRREFDDIMQGRRSLFRRMLDSVRSYFVSGVSLGIRGSEAERREQLEGLVGRGEAARKVLAEKCGVALDVNQESNAYHEMQGIEYHVRRGDYDMDHLKAAYGRFCTLYDAMADIEKASSAKVLLRAIYTPGEGLSASGSGDGDVRPDRSRQKAAYQRFVRSEGRSRAKEKGVRF